MWTSLLLSLAFAWSVSGECLDWDIRPPIEDCEIAVNVHGEAFLLPHAQNCSRFWVCNPNGDICLTECAKCPNPGTDMCPEGVLYFDWNIVFPIGPACDWATNIDCDHGDRPDYTTMFPSPPTWTPATTEGPGPHTTQKPPTNPTTHASTKPPTHPPTHPTNSPGTTTPGDCPDCVCTPGDDGWYKPYPGNCHKYYECTKTSNGWEITIFDCGSWVFDPHQASCTWPELAEDDLCK